MDINEIVVGVVDVGAPKKIGWAIKFRGQNETGQNLDDFIDRYRELVTHHPGALGFEAPLFVPVNRKLSNITSQRSGEAGRPWSAGAGATVTTIGLAVMSHVFEGLREDLAGTPFTLDWHDWSSKNSILVFEAFVSGAAHAGAGDHHLDALKAADTFSSAYPDLSVANTVEETRVLSLAGACLLRAGLTVDDQDALSAPALVIKP
ncbi:hypothetical protein J7382_00125 [Shimia sp. R11_0]|uniref:hypothetical protein n=1 Tax=Shimia sp. R11_0 TaxID=2821096 RepID=UPI001ADADA45|nr:hypothetical protein [Shimia sp. R11_0]MBO9475925.1 hypothetical protein [Shimia sp. R11_0]